jgi:cell division septum initiation protein DivIVA
LLLVLVILPVAGVVVLREGQPVTYAATAVIQGQGTIPDSTTQVSAIQSRVAAVATDPAMVQAALTKANISGNAPQIAKHEISISPMSSSAIMTVTVTDKDPTVALDLARALAPVVVNQLNQLGVASNPELAALAKTNSQLVTRRDQLRSELANKGSVDASTSVQVQSLLSQLSAAESELANNESEQQQVLATLTTETGASVVSLPIDATGASRHAAVYGVLAGLLGLIIGLLFAALREVLRPTVAQPAAGARELGAVMFGTADEHRGRIVALGRDLPERLNLAAHRAGARTVVLTGPGSPARLSSLAARLRARESADGLSLGTTRLDASTDPASNGEVRRPSFVSSEHRTVGLATTDWSVGVAADQVPEQQRTIVTLNDIRLGAPPPDAALVVVLPRFASHSALDQAADLGVTADWPILGVIGIRRKGWLAALIDRDAARTQDTRPVDKVSRGGSPNGIH